MARTRRRKRHLVTADFRVPALAMEDGSVSLKLRAGGRTVGEIAVGRVMTANFRDLRLTRTGSAVFLRLRAGRRVLGVVEIGRGSLWWSGKGKRRLRARKIISWTDFAKKMNELAYEGSRRRHRA